jgi:hypothetical protein
MPSFADTYFRWWPWRRRATPSQIPAFTRPNGRVYAGRRISFDRPAEFALSPKGPLSPIVNGIKDNEQWRMAQTPEELQLLPVDLLTEAIANISPDISKAIWDWLRFCNSGWEVKVTRPGSEATFKRGQKAIDEFLELLTETYGSIDVIFERLFMGAFLRGAFFGEIVLDADMNPVDLVIIDPSVAQFRRIKHPTRGMIWQLGQQIHGKWVNLEVPTVRYIPIDPLPGKPYGRPMINPAIWSIVFMLGLMNDIQRVVAQQGYPRLDIAINSAMIAAQHPELMNDGEALTEVIQEAIDEVQAVYSELQPDDAYIHTDHVTVNRPVGTIDASSLEGVTSLTHLIERQTVRALKTMPLLFGLSDSTTETHANRQWEITSAGISSVQHAAEHMIEHLFATVLRAKGITAKVNFRFANLRTSEEMRDQQVLALKIRNGLDGFMAGWLSQEEACMHAFNKEPVAAMPLTDIDGGLDNMITYTMLKTNPDKLDSEGQ